MLPRVAREYGHTCCAKLANGRLPCRTRIFCCRLRGLFHVEDLRLRLLAPRSADVGFHQLSRRESIADPQLFDDVQVLRGLPDGLEVPVLLVQHIEPGFEEGLIQWLSSVTQLSVRLASDGARLCPGELLVAPTGSHLGVGEGATAVLSKAAPIGSFRPSATFLFRTVARVYGRRSVAAVLTGMGRDGADGVMEVGRAGGFVIAQDDATSVVHGMPTAAIDTGMVSRILPVEAISGAILARCRLV